MTADTTAGTRELADTTVTADATADTRGTAETTHTVAEIQRIQVIADTTDAAETKWQWTLQRYSGHSRYNRDTVTADKTDTIDTTATTNIADGGNRGHSNIIKIQQTQ